MPAPRCPIHNVEMILRTARRSSFAGNKFWGCPRWKPGGKGCNEKVQFTEESPPGLDEGVPETGSDPQQDRPSHYEIPRTFTARGRERGYLARFFECIALPEDALEKIILSEPTKSELRAISQWRLDCPDRQESPNFTQEERQVLSVAWKILTRGRLTLSSPDLENKYREKFSQNSENEEQLNAVEELLSNRLQENDSAFWFDSQAEKVFYQDFLLNNLGRGSARWVIPQVELTSLLSQSPIGPMGRVDFLICHPKLKPTVVEIDGEQHQEHSEADKERDSQLTSEDYNVIRIPAREIEHLSGEHLSKLRDVLADINGYHGKNHTQETSFIKFMLASKISHQIQITLLHAIEKGFLSLADVSRWCVRTDLKDVLLFDEAESDFICATAIKDFICFLNNLRMLYSIPRFIGESTVSPNASEASFTISFSGKRADAGTTVFLQDTLTPFRIASSALLGGGNYKTIDSPPEEVLTYFLQYIFRKKSFWDSQIDGVIRTLQGKDSIILLPTGGGKSIIFQLSSLLLPGGGVVIAPIISLMDDQIDNLQFIGIDRVIAITGQIESPDERAQILSRFGQGEYLLTYVAPERFQMVEFREALQAVTVHTPISLVAVDEAHCVSEWGHDFRTAYLNVGRTSRECCKLGDVPPPLLALTGTASRVVLKDVQRELEIADFEALITPKSFDRSELIFHAISSSSGNKEASLMGYLGRGLPDAFSRTPGSFFQANGRETYSGLVFCPHVNGDYGVQTIGEQIRNKLHVATDIYAGKAPKYYSADKWNVHKKMAAYKFKHNELPLLACTKAFGMGIDKPNVRFTVHYGIPASIESFYQEAGRAGRDRKQSHCCVLVSDDNPQRTRKLLDQQTSPEEIKRIIDTTSREDQDDIMRMLWLQIQSFPGVDEEKAHAVKVLEKFQDLSTRQTQSIVFSDMKRGDAEKAIHRLLVIGVISDYTINFAANEFTIKIAGATKDDIVSAYGNYVANYHEARRHKAVEETKPLLSLELRQFTLQIVSHLLTFIYEVIERGRRRALQEMLLAVTVSPSDNSIRQRIIRYLESTEYSESLELISNNKNMSEALKKTKECFANIGSPREASALRGEVARYLESYPDHPWLLILRALSEICCRDKDLDSVRENFEAAIARAPSFNVAKEDLFDCIIWSINKIVERSKTNTLFAQDLQISVLKTYPERMFALSFLEQSPAILAYEPAWFLLHRLANNARALIVS